MITGTIKANFPTRISFQVTSKIDSRTILGEQGAEQLLGQGDMLYMEGGGRITRVHGPFVSDEEVERVVAALKEQGEPAYVEAVTEDPDLANSTTAELVAGTAGNGNSGDELYDQAVALVVREQRASTSFVQRHLQIGYNRAARIIERMESEGVVSRADRTAAARSWRPIMRRRTADGPPQEESADRMAARAGRHVRSGPCGRGRPARTRRGRSTRHAEAGPSGNGRPCRRGRAAHARLCRRAAFLRPAQDAEVPLHPGSPPTAALPRGRSTSAGRTVFGSSMNHRSSS